MRCVASIVGTAHTTCSGRAANSAGAGSSCAAATSDAERASTSFGRSSGLHPGPFTPSLAERQRSGGDMPAQPCCASAQHSRQQQAHRCSHRDPASSPAASPSSSSPPQQPPPSPPPLPPRPSCRASSSSHSAPRLHPHLRSRWPPQPLLALLLLLLLPTLLTPAAAGGSSRSSGGGSSSQLRPELDLRQLQQSAAAVGFAGKPNPDPSPSASNTLTPTPAAAQPDRGAAASSNSSYELPGSPEELTACLNAHQPPLNDTPGTSWDAAMRDTPTYFQVVGLWWSRKAADVPLTITTQLSWNRKWQLKAMCRSWGGPIAAVMHMPVLLPRLTRRRDGGLEDVPAGTLTRAVDKVAAFHAKLDAGQPCKLDLMLLAEPYRDGKSLVLYPVNTLRNYARLMARTPLIGLVDVDLIVASSLRAELLDPDRAAGYMREAAQAAKADETAGGGAGAGGGGNTGRSSTGRSRVDGVPKELVGELNLTAAVAAKVVAADVGGTMIRGSQQRSAWVLPAFATRGGSVNLQVERAEKLAAAGSKAKLKPYYKHGKILRFDWGSTGHKATQYGKWFNTTEPYVVEWSERYEPWVFVDRLTSSWADSRFRGYGKNKISHVRTLAYDGYELRVHPTAYLVHRPHLESSSSSAHARGALYGKKTKTSSMYGHNVYLYKMIQLSMAYGNYTPVVDPATAACRRQLSWWRPPDGSAGGGGNT